MSVTISVTEAMNALQVAINVTSHPDAFLHDVQQLGVKSVKDRLTNGKTSPDGAAWATWSERTSKYRAGRGNAGQGQLWDSGALLNSINGTSDHNTATVETSSPYAAAHEHGFGKIPARPFMSWSSADLAAIDVLMNKHFGVI